MSQEEFWAGDFGTEYISRNIDQTLLDSNIYFFSSVLEPIKQEINTVIELGANVGMNYLALSRVLPSFRFTGVEINKFAAEILRETGCEVQNVSINDFSTTQKYDLVLTKTVLIHIAPEKLDSTYEKIYNLSSKWILIAEYYNSTPIGIPYRGFEEKLFKRDFAGELISKFPNLKLVNYGFLYHGDEFPQDDITWFLLKK